MPPPEVYGRTYVALGSSMRIRAVIGSVAGKFGPLLSLARR